MDDASRPFMVGEPEEAEKAKRSFPDRTFLARKAQACLDYNFSIYNRVPVFEEI
jgi:hypothetical protein